MCIEIKEYALKIGISLEDEPHLLPLAIDGLTRPLPTHWQPWFVFSCSKINSQSEDLK